MEEKAQLRNKLQFSEHRFKAVAENATDAILISDENSTVIFANKKACQIFGYGEDELVDTQLAHLMPQKYREAHKAGMDRFIRTEQANLMGHTIEIEGLRKDGAAFPMELSLSCWKEGSKYFFSGIIRDASRRKEEEEEREVANQKLQQQQLDLENAYKELQTSQEEYQAANEELQSSQEELLSLNEELSRKEETLKNWNKDLEKKVRERTLQIEEQREWLHNLFMQVPALICLLKGREGTISLFNPNFSRLWGERDLMGKAMRQAWPELEGQPFFDLIEEVFDTTTPIRRNEFPAMIDRHNNGHSEQVYFNFLYAPYFDTSGSVEGIIIYAEDVTSQVLARKAIEESAERYIFMANAMPQKVWTAQADGSTDFFNQKWIEYTGLPEEELKGWGWRKVIHPEDLQENERAWMESLQSGTNFQLEHRFKRYDGQYRWHLTRGLPQLDEQGNVNRWIGTSTDIHDQKQVQEQLLQTQSLLHQSNSALKRTNLDLDNFIYTASHDLKSPVVNLEGLVNIAQKKIGQKLDEQERVILSMMESSVLRLKKTIGDLTEITKIQKGTEDAAELINFEEIFEEVKADNEETIRTADAQLELFWETVEIKYRRKDLRSILYNLLSNALKYRSPERKPLIRVRTYQENGTTVLSVNDNGLGVSEKQLPKLFTMFKRLHMHVEGTGIGLYIVKRIVENNGGRIKVNSTLNAGSTFYVYF